MFHEQKLPAAISSLVTSPILFPPKEIRRDPISGWKSVRASTGLALKIFFNNFYLTVRGPVRVSNNSEMEEFLAEREST